MTSVESSWKPQVTDPQFTRLPDEFGSHHPPAVGHEDHLG
jgi:hypothetical protein